MKAVFFSYSHADEALRDELEKHLSALRREGAIQAWHDRRITAGQELGTEIDWNLLKSDVVLLLFSSDFLASHYCYELEAETALKRHEAEQARVIPVILRPCDWQSTPFGKLLAAPRDGKPVTRWPDRDEAFLDIVRMIREALRQVTGSDEVSATSFRSAQSAAAPRSSNLRLAKAFTERDKDKFLAESFEYISIFFRNSLSELEQRNPGVETQFQSIDGKSFEASVYVRGAKGAHCGIWWGDRLLGNGIKYSSSGVSTNSFNESLSVETDDQSMFLKPLGMARIFSQDTSENLSEHGAAEYFWALLIERLQGQTS